MTNKKSWTCYAALAVLLMASGYALLTVPMEAALFPHATLIRLIFGANYAYNPKIGYEFPGLMLVITQNCSGAKLYASAVFLLAFGFPGNVKRLLLYAACALPGSVLMSVVRIAVSAPFVRMERGVLIHTLISLTAHFAVLAGLYAMMYIISKNKGGKIHGNPQ